MNDYIILIGVTRDAGLGDEAEADLSRRKWALYDKIFSFGSAWHGNQTAVLLKSSLRQQKIFERVSPLVGPGDLVVIMEPATSHVMTIGLIADEDGFDTLFANAVKFDVWPNGETHPAVTHPKS